jgi:hypothetical protein
VHAGELASNNCGRSGDVSLVEGEFAQLMALFAAWRADIDSEPFAYSDEELLRAARRPACLRLDHRAPPPFVCGADHLEPPPDSRPHWT